MRAGAGAAVQATFPVRTRVVAASPPGPGDRLEVTVGVRTHVAPSAPPWACPTGVWVLVLDRSSLEESGSGIYPLCTEADAAALGTLLKPVPSSKIVILNSLNHTPGVESRTLPGLGKALAEIGVRQADFAAVDLATTAFSVYGIPGLSAGQAFTGRGSATAEAHVPVGSATGASINGELIRDNHANFALTLADYRLYNIAADGAITLDGHVYPVPAKPAGFKGGFHLLVVERQSLEPVSDILYATNDSPAAQYRMRTDLANLAATGGDTVMIFLASVGDPVGGAQLPSRPANLPKGCQGSAPFTVTCTFKPTKPGDAGSQQAFLVPASFGQYPLDSLRVTLQGGYGGYAKSGGQGGNPSRVTALLPVGPTAAVKPGGILYVEVAGEGTSGGNVPGGLGGWKGGGGGGGGAAYSGLGWPGGGGGASDIRTVSRTVPDSPASRIAVAAGGGGAGGDTGSLGTAAGGNGGPAGGSGVSGGPTSRPAVVAAAVPPRRKAARPVRAASRPVSASTVAWAWAAEAARRGPRPAPRAAGVEVITAAAAAV